MNYKSSLVGGLEHFLFSHILATIIPTDYSNIFQGGGSTTKQYNQYKSSSYWTTPRLMETDESSSIFSSSMDHPRLFKMMIDSPKGLAYPLVI